MENSLYIGLSKQIALRNNMDTIANNIANMNTGGYRAQNLMFEEYLRKTKGDPDPMSFVSDRGQYENTENGPLQQTENPLDIAVTGPGFIGIQGPGGKVAYSRAGSLHMDASGQLLNIANFPVANAGGSTITIPAGSTEIKIDEKGVVSNQDGQIDQIMLVEFADTKNLKPAGNTLYETDSPPLPASNTRIKQGMIEGSNVKPVLEMTRMVDTLRTYQSVQNVLQSENDRLRSVIQKLTKQ